MSVSATDTAHSATTMEPTSSSPQGTRAPPPPLLSMEGASSLIPASGTSPPHEHILQDFDVSAGLVPVEDVACSYYEECVVTSSSCTAPPLRRGRGRGDSEDEFSRLPGSRGGVYSSSSSAASRYHGGRAAHESSRGGSDGVGVFTASAAGGGGGLSDLEMEDSDGECSSGNSPPYHPPGSARQRTSSAAASRRGTGARKSSRRSVKDRKASSAVVLKWLEDNYEMVPGSCLPRNVLYTHYSDFCKRNHMNPSSAASFGKIIRMKFPNLKTRRLGTRGQSKYHYYGLGIKETSVYYRSVYSKKGLTRFSGATQKKDVPSSQLYNPSSKAGFLLPEFPKVSEINISKPYPVDKVATLLLMYRAHCQRVLDSVVRANFCEVQEFLMHFWQGMPSHMLPILGLQTTVDLIVVCDFVLYQSLCEVLVPATLQPLPESLMEEIVSFSHIFVTWLFEALKDLPAALGIRKVQTAEMFGKLLRRQTALVELAKGAHSVLRNSENITRILNIWRVIDFDTMLMHTPLTKDSQKDLIKEFAKEMQQLFVKQSSLEVYFEWMDSIIEKRICEPAEHGQATVDLSQDFLLTWNYFYISVEKQMNFSQFDLFRHLYQVLDEYVNYVLELLQAKMVERQYREVLKVHAKLTLPLCTSEVDAGSVVFPPTPDPTPLQRDSKFFVEKSIVSVLQEGHSFLNSAQFHREKASSCTSSLQNKHLAVKQEDNSTSLVNECTQNFHDLIPISSTDMGLGSLLSSPLTPDSSHFSYAGTNSPQSQLFLDPYDDFNLMYFSDSNASSSATTPQDSPHSLSEMNNASACSTVSSPMAPFGIAASLDLLDQHNTLNPYSCFDEENCNMSSGFNGTYSNSGLLYNEYDFDLRQFMSNPDDFLSNPFSGPTDSIHSPAATSVISSPMPIH